MLRAARLLLSLATEVDGLVAADEPFGDLTVLGLDRDKTRALADRAEQFLLKAEVTVHRTREARQRLKLLFGFLREVSATAQASALGRENPQQALSSSLRLSPEHRRILVSCLEDAVAKEGTGVSSAGGDGSSGGSGGGGGGAPDGAPADLLAVEALIALPLSPFFEEAGELPRDWLTPPQKPPFSLPLPSAAAGVRESLFGALLGTAHGFSVQSLTREVRVRLQVTSAAPRHDASNAFVPRFCGCPCAHNQAMDLAQAAAALFGSPLVSDPGPSSPHGDPVLFRGFAADSSGASHLLPVIAQTHATTTT